MRRNRQSAQVSLAFLIASTISLGMLILTVVLIGQSFRGMESAKITAASATARQLAVSVDDRIHAITGPPSTALAVLSHDPIAVADTLQQRLFRLPVIADILDSSDIVSAVYAGYANGDFFLLRKIRSSGAIQFPDAPDDAHYLLQSVTHSTDGKQQPVWHFYDARRMLLERHTPPNYRFDPRTRGWYQLAVASGDTELTAPYMFFTTGEIGLTLSRGQADAESVNGNTVFGIDVTVTDLSAQLTELRQTPGTRIAIVSGSDAPLAYTGSMTSNTGPTSGPSVSDPKRLHDPAIIAALRNTTEQTGKVAVNHFTIGNRDWYGMTEPLESLNQENLKVAVAIPADELLADVWAALTRQTILASAIALLLLVIGWFLGRRVGRPLELLTRRVGALSRFRFDTPISVNSHIREARQLSVALDDMARTIRSFQSIATALNRGQDLDSLLKDILEQIVHILGQTRGAIYLMSRQNGEFRLAVDHGIDLPDTVTGINTTNDDNEVIQVLRRTLSGHPVFAILRNRRKQLIGALVIEMEHGDHTDLSDDLIVFVDEIAGSAAVAIETRELIENQQALLEGIIRLVANAIDAKSAYTGGHCDRVPKLAQMMVDEAIESRDPPFSQFTMDEDERYEFHLAAWLHDCGKITSPEYVVDKSVKLETIYNRIHEIRTRFDVLHRDAEIRCLKRILTGENAQQAEADRDREQQELQAEFRVLATANTGSELMSENDIEHIRQIGQRTWVRHFSDRLGLSADEKQVLADTPEDKLPATEPLLADKLMHLRFWGENKPPVTRNDPRNRWGFDMVLPEYSTNQGELHNLTVAKGTLTPEERFRINDHIVQTICMLEALPLPDSLANVPHLAGTHHERMDGEGYPCRLNADDMGIPERIMAVADIFEALTAIDRPYKEGKTLTESLTIMQRMVDDGHIDREVFKLFVRSGVYHRYAEKNLRPEQIDSVNEERFLS